MLAKDNLSCLKLSPLSSYKNNPLIALVQIRATDPVDILIHCNYSCPFVQFVGKNIYAFFIPEKPVNPALIPLIH